VAETVDEASEAKDEGTPSITELLVQLGGEISVLVFCEGQLAASRNLPEVRRAARDLAGAGLAALAVLTAFVFANVAALHGLTEVMSAWLAALVLCVVWLAVATGLALSLMVRAGQVTGWKWWGVFQAGPNESLADLERARADAEQAVRDTLARLAPAVTIEIATASVGAAGEMAGDMAGDVVEAGEDLFDGSEEIVEAIADDVPGGSVVRQAWSVVLLPGRFGIRVATTVLGRGDSDG
jgi:Putative Actinobacterial Holin-X, holin superfamily III